MTYQFEDINIGDEVYFYSTSTQTNYDMSWTVVGKIEEGQKLALEISWIGHETAKAVIGIEAVKGHVKKEG